MDKRYTSLLQQAIQRVFAGVAIMSDVRPEVVFSGVHSRVGRGNGNNNNNNIVVVVVLWIRRRHRSRSITSTGRSCIVAKCLEAAVSSR